MNRKKSEAISATKYYKNFFLLFSVILIMLLFFEIALRLAYPLYSNYNTEMWRYAKEIKALSSNPLIAHEHKPNAVSFLYGTEIKTNSIGWRDYGYDVTTDKYRIMILGDSITLGWGVDFNYTFPKILERLLRENNPNIEVINTGVGNYNSEMEVNSFLEKGSRYNPDMVVLAYYINYAEITHKNPNAIVYLLQKSYTYSFFSDKVINLKINLFKQNQFKNFYSALYEKDFEGRIHAKKAIDLLAEYAKKNNIPLYIVIIPEMHSFDPYPFQEVTDFVMQAASKNNIAAIDLLPYFKGNEPRTLWVSPEDAHPNAFGQIIIAKGIYQNIFKENPIFASNT
ncbi:SGNH/GDSL hydrolase family protein [Candidatus Woesearchaeota archaeon]|nr:SGNH/GDSL hydrolase family protein [Candidatus Woesearchaeota archaeon]